NQRGRLWIGQDSGPSHVLAKEVCRAIQRSTIGRMQARSGPSRGAVPPRNGPAQFCRVFEIASQLARSWKSRPALGDGLITSKIIVRHSGGLTPPGNVSKPVPGV